MLKPVNGHILVEPVLHDSFIASQKDMYEEIGTIVAYDDALSAPLESGDKIYFDSWLIAKYPKNEKEDYWLVKWEDVRAVEYAQDEIPK